MFLLKYMDSTTRWVVDVATGSQGVPWGALRGSTHLLCPVHAIVVGLPRAERDALLWVLSVGVHIPFVFKLAR